MEKTDAVDAPELVAKGDLEKVDLNVKAAEDRSFPAPKLVNYDNGTQEFHDTEVQKVTHPEIVQGAFSADNVTPKDSYVDNVETPAVVRETRVINEGMTKAQMQAHMDELKATRPNVFKDREADLKMQFDKLPD